MQVSYARNSGKCFTGTPAASRKGKRPYKGKCLKKQAGAGLRGYGAFGLILARSDSQFCLTLGASHEMLRYLP
jgi:hypothetical protein